MFPESITAIYYSATGNTEKVVRAFAGELSDILSVECTFIDVSTPSSRRERVVFGKGDLVIVASPTYRGKLPMYLWDEMKEKLKGEETPAVAICTFGNRSFDNSLAQLVEQLSGNGFVPFGAGAVSCRHAYTDNLAGDRPDTSDFEQIRGFAKTVSERLKEDIAKVEVPGDADAEFYKPHGSDGRPVSFQAAKANTIVEKCTRCGLCRDICPLGSIDADCITVSGPCFKCQACVRRCPSGAKVFDDPDFISHVRELEINQSTPKENSFF